MEIRYRLNPLIKILQPILLIGRMQVVAVQPKAHEYDLHTQLLLKKCADGDTATAPNGDGGLAESGFDGPGCICSIVCKSITYIMTSFTARAIAHLWRVINCFIDRHILIFFVHLAANKDFIGRQIPL